ncbi:MAG TPA: DUF2461 domain-containing protein [Chitinophagales bacterium]|nr:DUF2461 domain-containing protein [Chitinophagales bacterium]
MAQLHPQTLKFLSALKKNNNKEWFEKNRPLYETIRNDYILVVADVLNEISRFDPSVSQLDPKKCLFRINRDIRFSTNKAPYKTNIGAYISKGGKNSPAGGYYMHVQPGDCFVGGGIWMPEAEQLAKIRQEIDYNFGDFKKIIESKSFRKTFGPLDSENKLARPPKDYSIENPAIEYLKLKSFVAGAKLTDEEVLSKNYVKKLASIFKEMNPFISFLNRAVE